MTAKASSRIIKSQSRKDYDYIIGDAGNIYPQSTGLTKFYRHLLYIKPDFILIVDEIKSGQPSQFEWRLNTEGSLDKKSGSYFLVKNGDVVMDTHFIHPGTIDTKIDGNFLRVLPQRTSETIIATVLHPRRITDEASEVKIVSLRDSVIDLSIRGGERKIDVQLDLAKQKVRL